MTDTQQVPAGAPIAPPVGQPLRATDPAAVAGLLRELAGDPAYGERAAVLERLAAALDGSAEAELWAETDLLAAVDVDGPLDVDVPGSATVRFLEGLRTVLLFLPLLATWLGLWMATRAYSGQLAADPAVAGQPFLKLWVGGFGGRTIATLQHVAFVSGVLIALLVVLNIVLDIGRRGDEHSLQATVDVARRRLHGAVVCADVLLKRHRLRSPSRFQEELSRAGTTFAAMVGGLEPVRESLEETIDGLTDAAEKVATAVGSSAASTMNVNGSIAALARSVAALDARIDVFAAAVDGSVTTASDRLEGSMTRATSQVSAAMTQVAASVAGVADKTTAAGTALGATLGAALDSHGVQLAQQVGESSRGLVDVVGSAVARGDAAVEVSSQLYRSLGSRLEEVVSRLEQVVSRQAALEDLTRAREAVALEADRIVAAVTELHVAVREVAVGLDRLATVTPATRPAADPPHVPVHDVIVLPTDPQDVRPGTERP